MRLAGAWSWNRLCATCSNSPLPIPASARCASKIVEIAQVGLVRADVLRGEDMVELHSEPPLAAGEAQAVDIGQDDQLEMLLEVGERRGTVGKGRPVADRRTELGRFHLVLGHSEAMAQTAMNAFEQLRISEPRILDLDRMLDLAVSGE